MCSNQDRNECARCIKYLQGWAFPVREQATRIYYTSGADILDCHTKLILSLTDGSDIPTHFASSTWTTPREEDSRMQ